MTCEEYRVLLDKFLDGDAEEKDLAAMAAHEAECPGCAALRADMEALRGDLRECLEDMPPMPADLHEAWMQAVRQEARSTGAPERNASAETKRKTMNPRRRRNNRWLAAAAAAALVLGGTYLTWDQLDDAPMTRLLKAGNTPEPVAAFAQNQASDDGFPQQTAEADIATASPAATPQVTAAPRTPAATGMATPMPVMATKAQSSARTDVEWTTAPAELEAYAVTQDSDAVPEICEPAAFASMEYEEAAEEDWEEPEFAVEACFETEEEAMDAGLSIVTAEHPADSGSAAMAANADAAEPLEEEAAAASEAMDEALAVPNETEADESIEASGADESAGARWVRLSLLASDYDDTLARTALSAQRLGGSLIDQNEAKDRAAGDRQVRITLSIPADRVNDFLQEVQNAGVTAGEVEDTAPGDLSGGSVAVYVTIQESSAASVTEAEAGKIQTSLGGAAEFIRRVGLFLLNALPYAAGLGLIIAAAALIRKRRGKNRPSSDDLDEKEKP